MAKNDEEPPVADESGPIEPIADDTPASDDPDAVVEAADEGGEADVVEELAEGKDDAPEEEPVLTEMKTVSSAGRFIHDGVGPNPAISRPPRVGG